MTLALGDREYGEKNTLSPNASVILGG